MSELRPGTSLKPYRYAKLLKTFGTGTPPVCAVCLQRNATRLLKDYFANDTQCSFGVLMCDACEPGKPCAAFRRVG